jgi:tRNA threonylcarbamoyladenosine biosynthesis protein TsaE
MTNATVTKLETGAWASQNEGETFSLGVGIGESLAGGEVILLDGPLGAGKTVLVKGIAHALGVDETEVTSPSFTLVNIYHGRLLIYHIDLYRLNEGAAAAHAVDLDELMADEKAVVIIEWAERMGRYPVPANGWHISIAGDGEEPRRISLNAVSG